METFSAHWSHVYGDGYICALPIENYTVGFVVMTKVGELADRLAYYPTMTLEPGRVIITIAEDDYQKAVTLSRVIDELLPPPKPPTVNHNTHEKQPTKHSKAKSKSH